MPKLAKDTTPQLSPLHLPHLAEGYVGDLEPGCDLDGIQFSKVELPNDLSGASFLDCELVDCSVERLQLRGGRMIQTHLNRLAAPGLAANGSTWRDVVITASRLGAVDVPDAEFRRVLIVDSKLGWVNLRGANVRDVLFRNCTLDEVDFGGAKVDRVKFENCRTRKLTLNRTQAKNLDLRGLDFAAFEGFEGLRGAVLSHEQLMYMTTAFAEHLGITVAD
ncbi:pentapeptide repeat-containing protein [Leucobacter sp. cx-42]|uniref:pentapeptide repeat-containing protein n=1 Tax=unclassified Leucobacter TaxID=2621730 RepID=UPI00165D7E11|nr:MULTISPECIES: pentapeptide repeat-containing protein [unclassified Leucobacter]MBC9955426.1 pentapeptide repeat-containing protein [Leucobacter sp. cx-42]